MLGLITALLPLLLQVLVSVLKKAGVLPQETGPDGAMPLMVARSRTVDGPHAVVQVDRETPRQWVKDAVVEFFTKLDSKLPWWIKPEEGLIESLLSDAINKALDSAGL